METKKLTSVCILCGKTPESLHTDIQDYEYGVPFDSALVICKHCGLVTHQPPIRAQQIPSLYPSTYLAHSDASTQKSIYGFLKSILAKQAVKKITSHVPEGGTFLEVGCGNGHLLRHISSLRNDIRLMGVDIE